MATDRKGRRLTWGTRAETNAFLLAIMCPLPTIMTAAVAAMILILLACGTVRDLLQ